MWFLISLFATIAAGLSAVWFIGGWGYGLVFFIVFMVAGVFSFLEHYEFKRKEVEELNKQD